MVCQWRANFLCGVLYIEKGHIRKKYIAQFLIILHHLFGKYTDS